MDSQRPPTSLERDWFYLGLPSQPKLVARSSSTLFHFGVDAWSSDRKTLTVVGEHAIVGKWNNEPSPLRNEILGILAQQDVDWKAIDILRIGYVDEEKPVILSISVSAHTSWETGSRVARDCREALVAHGLDDVHCEIKESILVNLASVLKQDLHSHPPKFHSFMYHLSDQLGTAIASLDHPRQEGTKGIYLRRTGGEPVAEIFALTCRHVCYSDSETGSRLPGKETLSSKPIIQLPEKTTELLVGDLNKLKEESIEIIEEESKRECHQERGSRLGKVTICQQEVRETDRLLQHFTLREALDTRVFGHVEYTSDYVVRTSKCLSDWCLIRLKADSHERRLSELSNHVYIGPQDLGTLFPCTPWFLTRDLEHDGTLHIQGIVADSELQNPRKRIVGMRGRTSGLSFGIVNQVKSVIRRTVKDGRTFFSKECCIVAHRNNHGSFTKPGDSGAYIFDLKGRAVGMVTGGITREDVLQGEEYYYQAMDVTYATPMEWILEDMKACGLSMEIL
ncbi:hypothetical protein LZ32DRAFT_611027 [Colletotrichum eremochloae]|nr:hypothetical protein LZ32DRAFT_611027 [Colletotrichum eremochloae]